MNHRWDLSFIMSTCVLVSLSNSDGLNVFIAKGGSQLLAFDIAAAHTFTDIGPARLETMISKSDSIVLAKVTETISLRSGVTIAKADVERTLKGPRLDVVFYQIDLRMLEDISAAQIGEKVLLFLYVPTLRTPSQYPQEIKKVTGRSPLFMIYHLGRGRLVTLRSGTKEYLWFRRGSQIILPDEVPVMWGFDSSDPDLGAVTLEDFMKYVAKQIAETSNH